MVQCLPLDRCLRLNLYFQQDLWDLRDPILLRDLLWDRCLRPDQRDPAVRGLYWPDPSRQFRSKLVLSFRSSLCSRLDPPVQWARYVCSSLRLGPLVPSGQVLLSLQMPARCPLSVQGDRRLDQLALWVQKTLHLHQAVDPEDPLDLCVLSFLSFRWAPLHRSRVPHIQVQLDL
jgi:hypothetical protein